MKNPQLFRQSLINSFAVLVYISLVASLMFYGDKLFGKVGEILSVVGILLLFVLSATIVGALVLGKPILLYLDNHKKEAIKLFFYTVTCLAVFMLIVFIILSLI